MLRFFIILFCFFLLSSIGCNYNPKPKGFPGKLYPCHITVTQEGQPLVGASVMFVPTDGDKSWGTAGTTGLDGSIEITTYQHWKGVPKGEYKIVISKVVKQRIAASKVSKDGEVDNSNTFGYFSLVAEQYGDEETTPLSITVDKKFRETFDVGAPIRKKVNRD